MGAFYQLMFLLCTLREVAVVGISLPGSAQVGDLFRPSPRGELESQCNVELKQLFENFTNTFAYDAMGKVPSGVLVGNWASLGHFDECRSIEGFKYCLADVYTSINETEMVMNSLSKLIVC
ncbi:uncharacterized protein LOC117119037 [Anneissia japonica]|uniref:uncharacterized protein LOC117119037 n=1 Tax=Anneissia japonica TaxID=1529436 RepID=UPI0014258148|nr:uncharacterized protein LOC117119037 [Anneissia japonica]